VADLLLIDWPVKTSDVPVLKIEDVHEFISEKIHLLVEEYSQRIMATMVSNREDWKKLSFELNYNSVDVTSIVCAKLFNNADFLKSIKFINSFIFALHGEKIKIMEFPNFSSENSSAPAIGLKFENVDDFMAFWSPELFANANIQSLVIPYAKGFSPVVVRMLLESDFAPNLYNLSLDGRNLTDDDFMNIVYSQLYSKLRDISLPGSEVSNDSLLELSQKRRLTSLSALNLGGAVNIDGNGLVSLSESEFLARNSEFSFSSVGGVDSALRKYIINNFLDRDCFINF